MTGMRLAQIEFKLAMIHLLYEHRIEQCEKTEVRLYGFLVIPLAFAGARRDRRRHNNRAEEYDRQVCEAQISIVLGWFACLFVLHSLHPLLDELR